MNSPTGNRTRVSRVTGGDTDLYTIEDWLVSAAFAHTWFWKQTQESNFEQNKKMFTQQWNIPKVLFVNLAIISLKMCWGGHDFLLLCSKNVNFKSTIRQKMTRLSHEVYCYCRMAAYSFTFGVFKTSKRYSSWNMQVKVDIKLLLRF